MVTPPTNHSLAAGLLCERLEQAVTVLREELERHLDHQSRVNRIYRDWHSRWSQQCAGLSQHLAMLESHLSTWMERWQPQPRLTVVGGAETQEAAGG